MAANKALKQARKVFIAGGKTKATKPVAKKPAPMKKPAKKKAVAKIVIPTVVQADPVTPAPSF